MKWYRYILTLLVVLQTTVLFNACTNESPVMEEKPKMTFHITLSTGGSRTAATTDDPDDAGEEKDYYINPYDVEVLLYATNGTFVKRAVIGAVTETDTPGVYDLIGSIEDITEGDYQMMALCNLRGSLTNNYTVNSIPETLDGLISQITYTYNTSFSGLTTEQFRIPMWGIAPATLTDGANISIDVLRAMAKVKVSCSAAGYILTGVSMTRVNNSGYLVAQKVNGVHQAIKDGKTNYNSTDKSITGITEPSIPASVSTTTNVSFVKQTDSSYILYVPEFNNTGNNETDAYMELTFTDSNGQAVDLSQPYLFFAQYPASGGINPTKNEWDIIRNDFFEYTVTGISAGKLEANVRVMPWNYVKRDDYVLSQDSDVELTSAPSAVSYNGQYTNITQYDSTDTSYAKTSGYATFTFKVTEPQGISWKACLTDTTHFKIVGDESGYGGEKENENDKTYTLKVVPKSDATDSDKSTLLYFTIETLGDTKEERVNIVYPYKDGIDNRNYGIDDNYIHITQKANEQNN